MRDGVRIAGLGFTLEDQRWSELIEFESHDSLLGYDVIVWDVAASMRSGRIASAAQIARRDAEIKQHLSMGKALVVMLPPLTALQTPGGRLLQMSTDDLLPVEVSTVTARGDRFELIAGDPFQTFWNKVHDVAAYASYLAEPVGEPLLRIRDTSHVVATRCAVGEGAVLLLPCLDDNFHYIENGEALYDDDENDIAHSEVTDALLDLLDADVRTEDPPEWTTRYLLSGELRFREERTKAQKAIEKAAARESKAAGQIAALRQRKHLLSGTGDILEQAVHEAFRGLGLAVDKGTRDRTDRILRAGRRVAVVEIKGKTKSASERDAAQLQKWVSDYHATQGRSPKGILVVNAWRTKQLDQRAEPFPDQMLKFAADQQNHCLLTSTQLLQLWLEAEQHPKRRKALISSLFNTIGRYPDRPEWEGLIAVSDDDSSAA